MNFGLTVATSLTRHKLLGSMQQREGAQLDVTSCPGNQTWTCASLGDSHLRRLPRTQVYLEWRWPKWQSPAEPHLLRQHETKQIASALSSLYIQRNGGSKELSNLSRVTQPVGEIMIQAPASSWPLPCPAASWSQGWKHSPVPARVYLADGMKLWSLWEQLSSGSLRQVRKSSMASLPTEGHTNSSQQKGRHLLMEESMKWPCSTSKNQPRSRFNYQLQKIRRPC